MIKEILKSQGLTEEQTNSVLGAMKEAKVYTTKLENIDERYTKLKAQKTDLECQIKERDTQLADLSKNNKDNNELLTQIKDLQALNKQTTTDFEAKISKMEFDYALDNALSTAKCKNNKALKALLDMNSIKYQENEFEGLKEQLNTLKESDSYLFDVEVAPINTGTLGNFGRSSNNPTTSKEDFRKMSYTERMNLYNTNKELFNQLNE